eukprot:jgi/Ulvmu1/1940/UM012_0101.1
MRACSHLQHPPLPGTESSHRSDTPLPACGLLCVLLSALGCHACTWVSCLPQHGTEVGRGARAPRHCPWAAMFVRSRAAHPQRLRGTQAQHTCAAQHAGTACCIAQITSWTTIGSHWELYSQLCVLHSDRSRTQQRRGNRPGNKQTDRPATASTKATRRTTACDIVGCTCGTRTRTRTSRARQTDLSASRCSLPQHGAQQGRDASAGRDLAVMCQVDVLHSDRSRTQQRRGNRPGPGNTQTDRQATASTRLLSARANASTNAFELAPAHCVQVMCDAAGTALIKRHRVLYCLQAASNGRDLGPDLD